MKFILSFLGLTVLLTWVEMISIGVVHAQILHAVIPVGYMNLLPLVFFEVAALFVILVLMELLSD
jgi:hypothetical protein